MHIKREREKERGKDSFIHSFIHPFIHQIGFIKRIKIEPQKGTKKNKKLYSSY